MKTPTQIITIVMSVLFFSCESGDQATGLTVDKTATMDEVQFGDEFNIQITIHGYDDYVPEFIPFDVCLLIDKSASMDGDPFVRAKEAAIQFVDLAESSNSDIRISVVTFGEGTSILNGLSTNYLSIRNNINNLSSANDNETHFHRAMETANNILVSGSSAVRIAILLTDGCPTPNESVQVQNINDVHIPFAQTNSLRYYTIGLGNTGCSALLQLIASSTNGEYRSTNNPNDLNDIYEGLFDVSAHTIVSGQIILKERVDLNVVEIVPGTFEVDNDLQMPSASQLSNFYSTGSIDISMGELRSNKLHTVSFRVKTKSCLPIDAEIDFLMIHPNLENAKVEYILGIVPSIVFLPDVEIKCWKDPGFSIRKEYDPEQNVIAIKLISRYVATTSEDRIIHDIDIREFLSMQFQYIQNTADPALDAFVSGGTTDMLYWHVDELAPQEEITLQFNVEQIAYLPRDGNPLKIQAEKYPEGADPKVNYLAPDGIYKSQRIPQVEVTAYILPSLPSGRPDLGISCPFNANEVFEFGLEPYDPASDPNMATGGPITSSNWPLLDNFLAIWETEDIWIDNISNGYVADWDRDNAIAIQNDIDHVKVDVMLPHLWSYIIGQGDLYKNSEENRLYGKIYSRGEGPSISITDGVHLYVKNFVSDSWDLLSTIDLPVMDPNTNKLIMFQIPPNSLQNDHLNEFGEPSWNAYTSEFKLEILVNSSEKHTNNNISSEKVFVAQ